MITDKDHEFIKENRNARLAAIWSTRKYLLECDLRIEEEAQNNILFITQDNEFYMSPFDVSHQHSLKRAVLSILEFLNFREARILALHFGLFGPDHTLDEVGEIFNISRERVRQIKDKAIRKLRIILGKHIHKYVV